MCGVRGVVQPAQRGQKGQNRDGCIESTHSVSKENILICSVSLRKFNDLTIHTYVCNVR